MNRNGQNPNGYLPSDQWEKRYREQISYYEELCQRYPNNDRFKAQLLKYQNWLATHLNMVTMLAEQ